MTISIHPDTLCVGASFVYDAVQNRLREKVFSPPEKSRREPSRRGRVNGISKKSARRLSRKGVSGRPRAMLTLTYPSDFPPADVAKRHLRAFLKRLFRRFPRIGVLWRLEFQKRGAPHFHLLVQGVFAVPFLRVIAALAWIQGTRRWGIKHNHPKASYRHGVQVDELMSGDRKEAYYIAKYISKEQYWPDSGRMWGRERWREYHEWVYHVKHFPGARIYKILQALTLEYGPVWTLARFQYRMLRRALVDDEFYEKLTSLSKYRGVYIYDLEELNDEFSAEFRGACGSGQEDQYENWPVDARCDGIFHGGEQGFIPSGRSGSGCSDGEIRQGLLFSQSGEVPN